MNKALLFFILLFSLQLHAQDCTNGRFLQPVFPQLDITKNIKYARKKQSDGQFIDLRYDIYEPRGDTASLRPVMLLIHGGAYLKLLDQNSPDIVLMCEYFAKRGYVTMSIDYRQEPNLLAILSEESMVKAVTRALIDTKDAVDHIIITYKNGNPYRIDTSKTIMGGVSAGAISTMFICYLDSLHQMPQEYWQWVTEASEGRNVDSILRHRFDEVKPKIAISVSGAVLDTNWIVPNNIDFLLVHGSWDQFVPYTSGFPLGLINLPKLFGGKTQYPRMINQGIRCEFEDWVGRGHVPFMNLDVGSIITFQLINQPILDSTERHIARFCYGLTGCGSLTGIHHNRVQQLKLFPNPSNGNFTIDLPAINDMQSVSVVDINGRIVYFKDITSRNQSLNLSVEKGSYLVRVLNKEGVVEYSGKVLVE